MRKNISKIKELKLPRYYGVISNNVVNHRYSGVFASSTSQELIMAIPYSDLIEKIKSHVGFDTEDNFSALQQFRNYLSALNGYLAFCGKTVDANVGFELSTKFDERLPKYLASLEVAPRTRADRATQLRAIQRIYQQGVAQRPRQQVQGTGLATFTDQLRRLVAAVNVAPKTLAKQNGVDPNTLRRWLAGAKPRPDTFPALRRLESRFGLERDTFVQLIEKETNSALVTSVAPAWRLTLAARTQSKIGFSEKELSATFLQEWRGLVEYKVAAIHSLERQGKGHWRQIPMSMSMALSDLAAKGNMRCPSADMFITKFRQFLGVILRLAPEMGGLSWTNAPEQSLAFCAYPKALECYLQWMTDQSGGIRHKGQSVFASFVASLLRPQTGYLWQQPAQFRCKLPEEIRPQTDDAWQRMCEKTHNFLRAYIRSSTGTSRSPEEPIANLLALPEPFKPVRQAIERIQQEAAASLPGGINQARHKRNALLLALLLSNPLRVRSLASLTWLPNGQGSLRGSSITGWRIVLLPVQLKNGGSQKRTYSVKVADWVKPLLDEYMEEYRDTLLEGKNSQYLLVGDKKGGIWLGLSSTVLKLTRRYIPGSPGFGPHAFRHLVATTWLRQNPGDFLTVAELLNDSLATVLANYAHLRMEDSFARYESQFAQSS
ncbi:site-specific integrase [Duganella sp. Dugasp56]|uniref:site-specific integrase n=1 Tax=Duganella sp. Dugasp56 TaxID=3243046 RepID=UPI0039AFA32A